MWIFFTWGNWIWETYGDHRRNWVQKQSQEHLLSSFLLPNSPWPTLIGELRFWESSLLVTGREAKWRKNFKKYQHQRKFKRSCSLLPCQTLMCWRQQLSQERRKLIPGEKPISSVTVLPQHQTSKRAIRSSWVVVYFCRGTINSQQKLHQNLNYIII